MAPQLLPRAAAAARLWAAPRVPAGARLQFSKRRSNFHIFFFLIFKYTSFLFLSNLKCRAEQVELPHPGLSSSFSDGKMIGSEKKISWREG